MPYIFLNTVADLSDFNAPTPIILSGEYFHGLNSISNKCNSIVKDTGCTSVSLLIVSVADLLETLEKDGFKIIKVNRNGSHYIWILYKGRQTERKRRFNYYHKQRLQIQKENYSLDDLSSQSSMDKVDKCYLKQFYEPTTKSEQSQTNSPQISLIGGGDFTKVNRFKCQNCSLNSNTQIDKKILKDSQNQISVDLINNSSDFQCQCNIINDINDQIVNVQYDAKSCTSIVNDRYQKIIVPDESDNILMKVKPRINDKINSDDINVKSETIVNTVVNLEGERSKISIHEQKTSIEQSNSYLKFSSINYEEGPDESLNGSINKRALNILDKLEKRFQNEHEYFSNVRIKNSTKTNYKSVKKSSKKNKKIDKNNIILPLESKYVIESRQKSNIDDGKKKVVESKTDDINKAQKSTGVHLMKTPSPETMDSDDFYEATDSSENYDESKNVLDLTEGIKNHKSLNIIDLKAVGGTHNFRSINDNKPNEHSISKKIENSVKFNNSKEIIETMNNSNENRESLNAVKFVDHLDNVGKIESSKSHFRISHLEKDKIKDKKPDGDHLTSSKKQDIFKKKLQFFSNKTQYDFKTRMVERAQRTQQLAKSLRVTSAGGASRERSCIESVIESEKDTKNLKKNNITRNSSLAFSNKDRVYATPISNLKHRTHQRNNLMKS